jgi:GLPGLI family protein
MFAIVIPPSPLRPAFRALIPILLLVSASLPLTAQHLQGTIFYERKIDAWRHIDDEQMKAMVPQFQTGQYELFYRDSICFYEAAPKDEAPDPFDNQGPGGNHFVMRFGGPGDGGVLVRNYSSGQLLEQTTLADVQYVINDSIRSLPWKLSTDTLTILGHLCKKATAASPRTHTASPRASAAIVAWYCEDIPAPIGPDRFGGLPGAILKLDEDNGGTVFTATRLIPTADAKNMKTPTGKTITRVAFEKKMDEIIGPPDSLGRRIIRN